MRLVLAVAVAAVAAMPGPGARADSFTDQLDQAKQEYGQGDIGAAVGDLEFALQELRGKLGTAYLATFPAAPPGWTAQDEQPGSGGDAGGGAAVPFPGGGTVLKRDYRAATGEGTIEAQLMTGGSFLQGLASMFMNPQLMAAQPNARRVRIGRENAVVTYDPAAHTGQLMLDVAGKVTIMLDGKGIESGDPLVQLMQRRDIAKVKEIAGL